MEETTSDSPKIMVKNWKKLPWWMIYGSTLPSSLLCLGIIINDPGPILAIIMILTFGIPTKLLHHIYQIINLLRQKQPSTIGHVFFYWSMCHVFAGWHLCTTTLKSAQLRARMYISNGVKFYEKLIKGIVISPAMAVVGGIIGYFVVVFWLIAQDAQKKRASA